MTPRAVARAGTFAGALGALLWVHACREETSPKTGSETNFLQSCEATCDDGLSCVCGVCTQPCSGTGECTGLAPGAECVEVGDRAPEAACPDADCTAFCDLTCRSDPDCEALGTSFRCRDGYCRTLSWDGGLSDEDASTPDACPATTLDVGDNARTVEVGDSTRSYLVRVPESYDGTTPVPLVLDFHTLGGTPAGEAAVSGYRELAEEEGFIVAWPEGIDTAWNIGPCCTLSRDIDDLGFVRALIEQLDTEACIDAGRIYAVGVAIGGGMAHHLACNAPDLVAAVAPSAFDLLVDSEQPCDPERPVSVISFRGTADSVVPYEGGPIESPLDSEVTMNLLGAEGTFERWAEIDECTGEPSAPDADGCSSYSDCADGVEVTLCTTVDGITDWGDPAIAWPVLSRHRMP